MSAAFVSNFRSFLKLSNKQHMGPFYAITCKTDCCINFEKTEFPYRI